MSPSEFNADYIPNDPILSYFAEVSQTRSWNDSRETQKQFIHVGMYALQAIASRLGLDKKDYDLTSCEGCVRSVSLNADGIYIHFSQYKIGEPGWVRRTQGRHDSGDPPNHAIPWACMVDAERAARRVEEATNFRRRKPTAYPAPIKVDFMRPNNIEWAVSDMTAEEKDKCLIGLVELIHSGRAHMLDEKYDDRLTAYLAGHGLSKLVKAV